MSKCNLCSFESDSESKLSKHIQHTHQLKKTEYLIQTKYKGIPPLCGCGCGQETRYESSKLDFCKFISGHHSRLEGHWGDLKSEKRVSKIISTRKSKFASGEYDYIKDAIKLGRKNPSLGKNISKGAKGVPKPKPKGFGEGRIHSQTTKNKMSNTAINNLLKSGKTHRSGLEIGFEGVLEELGLIFTHSFYVPSIKKIYDFYLPEYKVLIEVDGDFWHCNPKKYDKPVCKSQEINLINDELKNKWAKDNEYKLLRFWEDDINNNIKLVKQTLLENIK
jgi:G:T-mismatch repair DNA endonuclease (very short patch repair protein)